MIRLFIGAVAALYCSMPFIAAAATQQTTGHPTLANILVFMGLAFGVAVFWLFMRLTSSKVPCKQHLQRRPIMWPFTTIRRLQRRLNAAHGELMSNQQVIYLLRCDLEDAKKLIAKGHFHNPKTGRIGKKGQTFE